MTTPIDHGALSIRSGIRTLTTITDGLSAYSFVDEIGKPSYGNLALVDYDWQSIRSNTIFVVTLGALTRRFLVKRIGFELGNIVSLELQQERLSIQRLRATYASILLFNGLDDVLESDPWKAHNALILDSTHRDDTDVNLGIAIMTPILDDDNPTAQNLADGLADWGIGMKVSPTGEVTPIIPPTSTTKATAITEVSAMLSLSVIPANANGEHATREFEGVVGDDAFLVDGVGERRMRSPNTTGVTEAYDAGAFATETQFNAREACQREAWAWDAYRTEVVVPLEDAATLDVWDRITLPTDIGLPTLLWRIESIERNTEGDARLTLKGRH